MRRLVGVLLGLAMVVCAASGVFAAATVCTVLTTNENPPPNPYANTAVIAVASNFYVPAQAMVGNYLATASSTKITICHNSTGHLRDEIVNGVGLPTGVFPPGAQSPYYDMFFAANETAATDVDILGYGYTAAFSYARGIPVFFGYRSDVTDVSGLIQNVSGGQYAIALTENDDVADYPLTAAAIGSGNLVAVANPAVAPYGAAAETILTAMGYGVDFSDPNVPDPAWVRAPLFSNIALTYSGVGTTEGSNYIKTGFVSKAQILPYENLVAYVEFTDPDYTLDQTAIQLQAAANGLYGYIQTAMSNGDWADFLEDQGYGEP